MDINVALLDETNTYLYDYDCYRDEIEHFLTHGGTFLERQQQAIHIIEGIMTTHGKKELLRHVAELARVEHGIRELEPWVRDHVVHALISFILGIYINEKFLRPVIANSVDDFQWKLAGIFHDIGYPVEVAKDIMEPFTAKINEIKKNLGVRVPDVYFRVVPIGFENLTNGISSFDLIQERLHEWNIRINASEEFDRMIDSGDICHGMISSLAVLYVIDLMYQKHNPKRKYSNVYAVSSNMNWNQIYFERDIIAACSAIYIHNLPSRCFCDAKIDRSKAPVAFLLKLSDCLQEWERPSLNNPTGFSASQFDIKIHDEQLIFRADIPDDKKEKMREDISSSLVAPDVQIC